MRCLVAREFTVQQEDVEKPERRLAVGEKYVYFEDTDTGKYYRPVEGFRVEAVGPVELSDRFVEVFQNG